MLWSNASLSNRSLCHEESYRFVTGGAITVLCCAVLGACGPPCAHWRIRFAAQLLGPSPRPQSQCAWTGARISGGCVAMVVHTVPN